MFKPLLKVIPSLSGNMKIVCPLEGYTKSKNKPNEFDCVVNSAYLNTISSNIYDKNIQLNLKNNSFEHDVNRFYQYYSNIFYKSYFTYSKNNIPILDKTSTIYHSNSDFEFGCKRVSYIKSGNTFAFFTPIYIEGLDDIKNKVFKIKCEFVFAGNKITKVINIPIYRIFNGNTQIENYLGDYLERYAEKIDDNVIYLSTSYKNIYYGISLKNGGFVSIEDNISKNLYNKYYSINDFDCILNQGFKRNSLMMKQILSLSFYFDPEKLLNNIEKPYYTNARIYISGKWYDNGKLVDFYNFSDNYNNYYENIYKLGINGSFKLTNSINNIMDMPYPAFNEASSTNYKYINTVVKNYNRWKLKYSNDNMPYIINNNYAFSANQNSLSMYKEFPLMYTPLVAFCKIKEGIKYNLIFDFENIYNDINYNLLNKKEKYYKLYENNFITNFFNIITKEDKSEKYINIFDKKYQGFWENVNKDGKVYYKGILYNLNNLYTNNSLIDKNYKIDKFGIFVEPHFYYVDTLDYNSYYKTAKIVSNMTYNSEISQKFLEENLYDYYTKFDNYIKNNILVRKDPNGNYYDLYQLTNNKYYDTNQYYDLNDIYIYLYLYNLDIDKYIDKQEHEINIGYKVIDCYNINNIYNDIYKTEENMYSKLIYRKTKFLEYEKIYWAYNKLYFSLYPNKTKYQLLANYELFEKNTNNKIVLYYKGEFIKVKDFEKIQNKIQDEINQIRNSNDNFNFDKLINKYYFINGLYDSKEKKLYTGPVFKLLSYVNNNYGEHYNNDDNVIYVDPYNLEKVYSKWLRKTIVINESINNYFEEPEEKYCRFLNNEHIYYYNEKLYLNEKGKIEDLNNTNIREYINNTIFIRVRKFEHINIDLNDNNNTSFSTILLKDEYIPLTKLGFSDSGELLNNCIFDNEKNYWYFNEKYSSFINDYIKNNPNIELYEGIQLNKLGIYEIDFNSFEVFFKKKMYKLNTDLYKLILSINDNNLYKDLYLYHLYNQEKYNINYKYNVVNENIAKNYIDNGINLLYSNIEEPLYPYFNEIYEENKLQTKIYSDYFVNNITLSYSFEDSKYTYYYRYNVPNINMLVYSEIEYEDKERYTIVNGDKDNFASIDDIRDKFIKNKNDNNLNSYNNIFTYTYNGINYGFYYINTYFSNTGTYINLQNEDHKSIDYVNYINDIDVSLINNYSYSYLISIYKNILPYLNNNNITKFLLNSSDILISPTNNKLDNIYRQYPNNIKDEIISYTIYNIKKHKTLELSRYFDNIVPYIYKDSTVLSYYLYYKNSDKYIIEYTKDIKNEPYIMHQEQSSIYKYVPITYFYTYTDVNGNNIKTGKYFPPEYKYYNNNEYYNLEKYFEYSVIDENKNERIFTEKELISYENDEQELIKIFKNRFLIYINGNKNSELDINSNILFLYKKYKVEFDHNFIGVEKNTNNRLYKLTIRFILL